MSFYKIGDTIIQWNTDNFPMELDNYMSQFVTTQQYGENGEAPLLYTSTNFQLDRYRGEKLLHQNETYELYQTNSGCFMIYHWAHCRFGYGFRLDDLKKGNKVCCYFNPKMREEIPITAARFFSTAGMHTKLLQRSAVILHASYIDWDGSAILFAAPSGTGKSTQAELWEQYAGAEIINGDRALLRRRGSVWHAFGYPCCGSSMICKNRTLPLKAIVILEQAKENRVEILSASQKIRALVSGTEIYLWDTDEINQAFHLAEQISKEVPVIKLACRPDKNAVTVLKEYLEVI